MKNSIRIKTGLSFILSIVGAGEASRHGLDDDIREPEGLPFSSEVIAID
jgi:hypothetical protein